MENKMNQKKTGLIIGGKFPISMKPVPFDTPAFQIMSNESAALIWHIKNPTRLELDDFKYGGIKIGVSRYGKILFFCINQQPFAEGDCPYHAQSYNFPPDMHIMRAATEVGLPLYLCVVDQKNILRALRGINLSKEVSDFIADTFEYQRTPDGSITMNEWRNTLKEVYGKYPDTKDLMDASEIVHIISSKKG